MKKILICTGGTGGHTFPAISLAQYLEKKNFNVDLITDYRAKRFINNLNLRNITFINIKTPTGKKGLGLIYSLFFFIFLISLATNINSAVVACSYKKTPSSIDKNSKLRARFKSD